MKNSIQLKKVSVGYLNTVALLVISTALLAACYHVTASVWEHLIHQTSQEVTNWTSGSILF